MTPAIIYQSVMSGTKAVQQLSNLELTGLSTRDDTANTDHGKLWGSFTFANGTYTLNLYMDQTKLDLVATATSTVLGKTNIVPANSSGLGGTVNIVQYQADDALIVVIALLSVDSDLQMNNLEVLQDYDPQLGFARFHLDAYNKVTDFIKSREWSQIFDKDFVDCNSLDPIHRH